MLFTTTVSKLPLATAPPTLDLLQATSYLHVPQTRRPRPHRRATSRR